MPEEARAKLKAGHQEFTAAKAEVEELRKAITAAKKTAAEAEEALEQFAELDQEVTRFRVQATKKGRDPKCLPEELKARLAAKRAADEELEQSRTTLDVLRKDLEIAEHTVRSLEAGRSMLAVAVAQEMADEIADELILLNARRMDLLQLIGGLASINMPIEGRMQFVGYSPKMSAAVDGGYPGGLSPWPAGIDPRDLAAARWRERIDALIANPDAEVSNPTPVRPSDVIGVTGAAAGGLQFGRRVEIRPEQ